MSITESQAFRILYAAHDAWNHRDIAALVALFDDDMIYWSNVGQNTVSGKPAFEAFLAPMQTMEGLSVPHSLRFNGITATANVEFYLRDQRTGYSHSGTFRQVLSFSGAHILRMDEYHDAGALGSFIALLSSESSA